MTITDESTIGSVAASFPSTISIFQRYKIDYCCGGGKTLHRSASEMGIDPENLIGQLIQASEQKPVDGHQDWLQADLTDLIDHILNTHDLIVTTSDSGFSRFWERHQTEETHQKKDWKR